MPCREDSRKSAGGSPEGGENLSLPPLLGFSVKIKGKLLAGPFAVSRYWLALGEALSSYLERLFMLSKYIESLKFIQASLHIHKFHTGQSTSLACNGCVCIGHVQTFPVIIP